MVLTTFRRSPEALRDELDSSRSLQLVALTGKQEAQLFVVRDAFVGAKLEDIESWNVAPKVLPTSKSCLRGPIFDEGRSLVLQDPVGLPILLSKARFAVGLVKSPVRLLTLGAAVLDEGWVSRQKTKSSWRMRCLL